jgi:hypothetical protein
MDTGLVFGILLVMVAISGVCTYFSFVAGKVKTPKPPEIKKDLDLVNAEACRQVYIKADLIKKEQRKKTILSVISKAAEDGQKYATFYENLGFYSTYSYDDLKFLIERGFKIETRRETPNNPTESHIVSWG